MCFSTEWPRKPQLNKAWRGGSKAQQSCDPATALGSLPFVHKMIR